MSTDKPKKKVSRVLTDTVYKRKYDRRVIYHQACRLTSQVDADNKSQALEVQTYTMSKAKCEQTECEQTGMLSGIRWGERKKEKRREI